MRKWWEFVLEGRGSGEELTNALKDFLSKGKNRHGVLKTVSIPDQPEDRNQISAPPGALEEEVEPESFEAKDTLEPNIWMNSEHINPDVRERLLTIASDFMDGLEVGATILDVRLTGSLANYNWSDYSDIDLHIVVDFTEIDEDTDLAKKFFDASRMRWNDKHDIKIYGYEVEIYVEDRGEPHKSTGIYSLPNDEWLVEPNPQEARDAWTVGARKKSDDIMTQINLIQNFINKKPKAALRSIDRLKAKIRKMRQSGLDSPEGQYSMENVVFKILRREGALDLLSDLKDQAYDSAFSMGQ